MRNLSFGSIGDDVKLVQGKLQELGYYTLAIDGRFGPGTEGAVMRFQRDNGLDVDGIVGEHTYAALGIAAGAVEGAEPAPAGTSTRRRRSLHVGLNGVDANQYNGWDGKLTGCENDCRTMLEIATADGYSVHQLLTAQATTTNVLAAIADAAQELRAGDVFFLTYAGHGGQVPDTNSDGETDRQDETWVLYDRMLIDDELEAAFSQFASGVDIVLVSDSCHSGTIYRDMFSTGQFEYSRLKESFYQDVVTPPEAERDSSGVVARYFPRPAMAMTRSFTAAGGDAELFAKAQTQWNGDLDSTPAFSWRDMLPPDSHPRGVGAEPLGAAPRRFPGAVAAATMLDTRSMEEMTTGIVAVRAMPLAVNADIIVRQARQYAAVKEAVRARSAVQARGLALSGCLDAQLSQEVGGNGVFTTALKQTWAEGSFTGSYVSFHTAILSQMGPSQTPQLSGFGTDSDKVMQETPFA
ncbi:Putative peptidoglycan binding domain-containing protein [Paramicrobacterium humi]|uniref:Putative peptidoglycan binding domain-containing protein n=1 Tax=Paramicrobacterium humi TaxID=640635 RepID=A0A1H4QMB4_9MICO|nr:caspase family protein [Microbacterium humi]SEC20641.1 Putative peptidoglycan binding domain-containing protein [Microbacterium humi]